MFLFSGFSKPPRFLDEHLNKWKTRNGCFEEHQLGFNVRRATVNDLGSLLRIEAECFTDEAFSRDQLVYCLLAPDFVTLAALVDDEIVGFVTGSVEMSAEESVGHVYTLDVKQGHRKRGIGSKLLESFESALAEKGVRVFVLEVRVDNIPARRLYSKHGYKLLARLKNYYDQDVDAVRLKKTLATS
jgi:ribosomal-protein-alanine N-acetyltransferase